MSKFMCSPFRLLPGWSLLSGLVATVFLVSGCGGGSGSSMDAAEAPTATILAAQTPGFNGGVVDPGLLMLLVPDTQSVSDPLVTAWIDGASEVGTRIAPITDSQFQALGAAGAMKYAGLVLPDQLHSIATDAIVTAIRNYVTAGGRAMLTYDFGALTLNGNNQPVYPIPKSRLSDLAGVDYVMYDALLDHTVGLGPVTALRSTMRELLVPPGKSMPYTEPSSSATVLKSVLKTSDKGPSDSVLDTAGLTAGEALYLPVSPQDPGGVRGFDPQQFQNLKQYSDSTKGKPRKPVINFGKAVKGKKVASVSKGAPRASKPIKIDEQDNTEPVPDEKPTKPSKKALLFTPEASILAATTATDSLDAYSGYLLGHLIYPSYVTSGTFTGVTLAQAPDFGLAAGVNKVGAGQVLFVNLPLTYLKGQTDALPMHGYLYYFVQHVLQVPRLSTMPNAIPGMTLDWHLDSKAAQAPTLALEQAGIFEAGLFSIEMTAGPDTINPGDGLGWNLNNNPVAQQFLQRMDALGHAVGSHGGWIHDYYGTNADETNQATYLQYLQLNRSAVDGAIGHASRGYSAPQGNNPNWAMSWLEQQGVVGAYFGGHTGLGVTRQYRDGVLRTPNLWVVPVTPQGLYATFEEFQDFAVPQQDVMDWYRELIDFAMTQNTHRMIYAHPPGANQWRNVLNDLIYYAALQGAAKFRWYAMPRMADFMATRNKVQWKQTTLANGNTRFDASHPVSLKEMVWMLPKARYLKPTLNATTMGTVTDGGTFWLVKAKPVTSLIFQAAPNPAFVPA
jgi:hypothetical protein